MGPGVALAMAHADLMSIPVTLELKDDGFAQGAAGNAVLFTVMSIEAIVTIRRRSTVDDLKWAIADLFGQWCVDTRGSGMVVFTRSGHHCPYDTELSEEPLKIEI